MTNTEAWDRCAAAYQAAIDLPLDVAHYGPDVPDESELHLIGDVAEKRVLELGCGAGQASIAFAGQGAHAIAVDTSRAQLAHGRALAAKAEARVEWHECDLADLAFLRADSIDLAFSAYALGEVEDLDRVFRQVHRVLRPAGAFVFSYEHPFSMCLGREPAAAGPGALALGRLEVTSSYFETGPVTIERHGERFEIWPRTIADVFAALGRAGFKVEVIAEPPPVRTSDPGPAVPSTIIWRTRKEGV